MTLVTPRIYGLLTSLCVPLAKLYLKNVPKSSPTICLTGMSVLPESLFPLP